MSAEDVNEINRIRKILRKYGLPARTGHIEIAFDMRNSGYGNIKEDKFVVADSKNHFWYTTEDINFDKLGPFPSPKVTRAFIKIAPYDLIIISLEHRAFFIEQIGPGSTCASKRKEKAINAMKEAGYEKVEYRDERYNMYFS